MKGLKNLVILTTLVFVSLALLLFDAQANSSHPQYSVIIQHPSVQEAASLGLNPKAAWDYGSFQWLELDPGDFARLKASGLPFTHETEAGVLQVNRFRFDPLVQGEPNLPETQKMARTGEGFRFIQMTGPANNARLEAIADVGVKILQYYPHHTYLVWGTVSQAEQTLNLDFVRWQGAFHPDYKTNSDLVARSGLVNNVDVFFYNDGNIDATLQDIGRLGGKIIQHYPAQPDKAFYSAIVEMDASVFDDLSQLNTVLWFGYSSPEPGLEDEMSSQIVAGNHPSGVPVIGYLEHLNTLGLSGAGVTWAVVDTGVDYDHPDLGSHIVGGYSFPGACNPPDQPGSDCSGGGHGTHVAGIVGGNATGAFADPGGFKYGLGVAPQFGIYAMNSLSASSWPPVGGWQEHSKRAVLGGAVGGNNSWTTGEGTAHGYQSSERTHDFTVHDGNFDTSEIEPFIQVFSAGNSGPNPYTLTAPKEGKNLIIVASSRNYRVGSIDTLSNFSSRGPAVDGRLGITVAAPGEQIASARNDLGGSCSTAIPGTNNLYAYCSGTSMAAPHVSGVITLATEWWRTFNDGTDPSPAMAKALLVNSAVDMGGADIPNIHEGWGRVNFTNLVAPQALTEYYDHTHIFTDTGQQWAISVGVADPSQPLKVTLAWTDAPGAVGANPALVNNLNLTVINNGSTYRGNVFSGGWSTPGGEYDNLNNLENIYIQNPGGSATIIVDAVNIAGDGVIGNDDLTDQNFALICYNCASIPDFTLNVQPAVLHICKPDNAEFNIDIGQILDFDELVFLSIIGEPTGTNAVFSLNPVPPPGESLLTISGMEAAATGSYSLEVTGETLTRAHSRTMQLNVFEPLEGAPVLQSPENGELDIVSAPTFTWDALPGVGLYSIEVATDSGFTNIAASASGLTSSTWTMSTPLNTNTTYFWRVWAENACGVSDYSAVWRFTTLPGPGDCGPGSIPNILYEYGFEDGAAGWTTGGTGNTWAISTANPFAGNHHYHGDGVANVSDQRLISPPVSLPADEAPMVLKFWHVPHLEPRTAGGCWDGGILEVSTDGTLWSYVPNANLLAGSYTGLVQSGYSNPLAGFEAWCGEGQPYLQTIADISSYAGQTVQFRMRLGTDSLIGRPGWDVDNVSVQSCQVTNPNINLEISVGTDPSSCALGSDITVPAGTEVAYCYTVENTGDVTFEFHDLEDSELGVLLNDFNISLPPGSAVSIIEMAVANATTSNTATWTASNGGYSSATSTATATVNAVNPNISLTLTVGTNENECSIVDSIFVDEGTEVFYCYTVENTGDTTLSLHDLVDEDLGEIFFELAYELPPGQSVNTVAAGLTISKVINETTEITTVWTAYDGNFITVSASASATVTVNNPSITLTKTVSIEPGICGLESSIEVSAGTEVFYCYFVTNTGNVTFSRHDLIDDQLGVIFSGFEYDLLPGESLNTVEAGISASLVAWHTTVNNAVWTAYSEEDLATSTSASAVVTVSTINLYLPIIIR
jgi:subtilisin family serine protease